MYAPTLLILHEFIRNETEKYRGNEHLLEGSIRQFGRKLGSKIVIKLQMEEDPSKIKSDQFNFLRFLSGEFWAFVFNKQPDEIFTDQRMFRVKARDFEFFGRINPEEISSSENKQFLQNCQLLAKSLVEGACLLGEHQVVLDFSWSGEMWVFDLKLV